MDELLNDKQGGQVRFLNWVMREDADSLVVAVGNDLGSCLQVWELREKALPVHEALAGSSELKTFNTVVRNKKKFKNYKMFTFKFYIFCSVMAISIKFSIQTQNPLTGHRETHVPQQFIKQLYRSCIFRQFYPLFVP